MGFNSGFKGLNQFERTNLDDISSRLLYIGNYQTTMRSIHVTEITYRLVDSSTSKPYMTGVQQWDRHSSSPWSLTARTICVYFY